MLECPWGRHWTPNSLWTKASASWMKCGAIRLLSTRWAHSLAFWFGHFGASALKVLIVSLCSHQITFLFLCCFISTEPLRGPPHRLCCLPVLQWCHRPWLCHHGDLQACTNQAWQVHTGELLFLFISFYIWGGYGKVGVVRESQRAEAPLI